MVAEGRERAGRTARATRRRAKPSRRARSRRRRRSRGTDGARVAASTSSSRAARSSGRPHHPQQQPGEGGPVDRLVAGHVEWTCHVGPVQGEADQCVGQILDQDRLAHDVAEQRHPLAAPQPLEEAGGRAVDPVEAVDEGGAHDGGPRQDVGHDRFGLRLAGGVGADRRRWCVVGVGGGGAVVHDVARYVHQAAGAPGAAGPRPRWRGSGRPCPRRWPAWKDRAPGPSVPGLRAAVWITASGRSAPSASATSDGRVSSRRGASTSAREASRSATTVPR